MSITTTSGPVDLSGLLTSLDPPARYKLTDGGANRVASAAPTPATAGQYSVAGVKYHQQVAVEGQADGVTFDGVTGDVRLPGFDNIGASVNGCWIGSFATDPASASPPYTRIGPQLFDRVLFCVGTDFVILIPASTNSVRVVVGGSQFDTADSADVYGAELAWTVVVSVVAGLASVYVNGILLGSAPWSVASDDSYAGRDSVGTHAAGGVSDLCWLDAALSGSDLLLVTTGSQTPPLVVGDVALVSPIGTVDSGKQFATDPEAAAAVNPAKVPNVVQVKTLMDAADALKADKGTYQSVPSEILRNGASAVPDGIGLVFTFDSALPVNRLTVYRDTLRFPQGVSTCVLTTNGTVVTATFGVGYAPVNGVYLAVNTIPL